MSRGRVLLETLGRREPRLYPVGLMHGVVNGVHACWPVPPHLGPPPVIALTERDIYERIMAEGRNATSQKEAPDGR